MLERINNASLNKTAKDVKPSVKVGPPASTAENSRAGGASKVGELNEACA